MKVTGVLVALAAAAPLASAMPFRLADVLSPRAPAREQHVPTFPDVPHIPHHPHHPGPPSNLTARAVGNETTFEKRSFTNETTHEKRFFVPQARSGEKEDRSFHNGHPGHGGGWHHGNGSWPFPPHHGGDKN